jgi:hypothetical protein
VVSYFEFLCAPLRVLCVSAVSVFKPLFTAETPRSQRLRREELNLGHYLKSERLDMPTRFIFSGLLPAFYAGRR